MSRAPPSSTSSPGFVLNNGLIDFQDTRLAEPAYPAVYPGSAYPPSAMYQPMQQPGLYSTVPPSVYERGVYPPQAVAAPAVYPQGLYQPASPVPPGFYPPNTAQGLYPPNTAQGLYPPNTAQGMYPPNAPQGMYAPNTAQGPCYAGPPSFLHVNGVDYKPVSVNSAPVSSNPKPKVSDSTVERHVEKKVNEFMAKKQLSSSRAGLAGNVGKTDLYTKDLKRLNDEMKRSLSKVKGK